MAYATKSSYNGLPLKRERGEIKTELMTLFGVRCEGLLSRYIERERERVETSHQRLDG
eukprot:c31331_g1_i1 orf=125-298(+)